MKIEKCPWCGRKRVICLGCGGIGNGIQVMCNCGARGPSHTSSEAAIRAWNRIAAKAGKKGRK